VDFVKDESLSLNYKKYGFYSNIKNDDLSQTKENNKQPIQDLSKYNLKAIYYTNINLGWVVLEDNTGNESYILACGEKLDNYVLSKLFKNYIIFEKDKKEYKLEIKEKESSNYQESNNDLNQQVIVKNNGATVSRDYLNSYIKDMDKIWNNIEIGEMKNGETIYGFKINRVNKDSVFAKIGLKEGDIIKMVNDSLLSSYADAFKIYNNIENMKYINMEILRENEVMELNYEIN
jgi:general secretion pathway protein C